MRQRVALALVALMAAALFLLINAAQIVDAWSAIAPNLSQWWLALTAALVVHLVGHLFRVLRTKIVIDEVNRGSVKGQFGALAVGFLFNALLPLRLGEIVRSLIIARTLRVSLLYTASAVVLERLFDVIFIGIAVLAVALLTNAAGANLLVIAALGLIAIAAFAVAVFLLLIFENRFVLYALGRMTGWFNPALQNGFRFRIWTLIFGFQRLIRDRSKLWRYVGLALGSWCCYVGSMVVLGLALLPPIASSQRFVSASYPFIAINSAWGQTNLYEFSNLLGETLGRVASDTPYDSASWLLLVVPMAALGVAALFFLRFSTPALPSGRDTSDFENKLRRMHDISNEMPAFLDSYFRGHDLARTLHKIEVSGQLSLVRFFKGGSEAVTALAVRDGQFFVKKIVPSKRSTQLRSQLQWLEKRAGFLGVVRLIGSEEGSDYFSIDLEFLPSSEPLFDYVHRVPLSTAEGFISVAWSRLYHDVYELAEDATHTTMRDSYLQRLFLDRVTAAALEYRPLSVAASADTLVINGESFDGLAVVLEKIRQTPDAWADLARYRESSAIHGDFTIDNLLVDGRSGEPILIDPSDDNDLRSIALDVARLKQSLTFGYEFLIAEESFVDVVDLRSKKVAIDFPVRRSARYEALDAYIESVLIPQHLTESERRSVLFHVGVFYGRMLTHRVRIAPESSAKYMATSVRALNLFLRQYPS